MYKCTIEEVRHVHSKDLVLECITPYTSANGGDYAHMLELFMVVDFPNGQEIDDDKGKYIFNSILDIFFTNCQLKFLAILLKLHFKYRVVQI